MEEFARNIKYALRLYLRQPVFTLIVILLLAVGIGANTAMFAVINAVLLRALPFDHPDRLVWMWGKWPGGSQGSISPLDLEDYRQKSRAFKSIGAFANNVIPFNLSIAGEPEQVSGYYVTANFFSTLGVNPEFGRTFLPEEEQQGRDHVVLLNHALWQQRFGGDKDIAGKMLTINGEEFLVAGVMPTGVNFPPKADLWVPVPSYRPEMKMRRAHALRPIGRLNDGFSIQQAQAELDLITTDLQRQFPDSNTGWSTLLVSLREELVRDSKGALWLLMGATAFVLLIACANVAHLLLVRANSRRSEMAIRGAFGAPRKSLLAQLITEGLLLSLIGSALGVALALIGVRLLIAMAPGDIPRIHDVSLNGPMLAFALLISILTGVVCGLAPALQAARVDVNEALKEKARSGTEGQNRNRVRNILVVAEVALALMLLIGSGLMIRGMVRLQGVDPGFSAANVLTMQLTLPQNRYADAGKRVAFFQGAAQRIGALAGVKSVGMISDLPLTGEAVDTYFTIKNKPPADVNVKPVANVRLVAQHYFQAMGITLLKGRYFTEQEELGDPVVMINDALARRYFSGQDPIGQHLIVDVGEPLDAEITGVVSSVHQYSLEADPLDELYLPILVMPSTTLVVRTAVDPVNLVNPIRREIRSIDSQQPIAKVRTMQQVVDESIVGLKFRVALLSIFAGIALVLAIAGVYGMMSYSVSQQSRSIGVRMALGAQLNDVVRMIVAQGMKFAGIGLLIGLTGAFALQRVVSAFLFDATTTDWQMFAGTAVLLGLVALLACYLPARRAARMDPVSTLRQE